MQQTLSLKPAIIVLTGASGSGKTTIAFGLKELNIAGVESINCDRVKIETPENIDLGESQALILRYWIDRLSNDEEDHNIKLYVLDTQIRPHLAQSVFSELGVQYTKVILVDCEHDVRHRRLRELRNQPELVNHQMDCWAAYLRGQADALNLPIIDGGLSIERAIDSLAIQVNELLNEMRSKM